MNATPEEKLSRRAWLLGLILVAATLLAYQPVWHAGFIWDDDVYVTDNPLLTASDGLKRIWFSTDSPSQYFPLTYTTFRLERPLWGLNPTGYHVVNVILHIGDALLLWALLKRLRLPGAWLAAAIFALHPVHVESVAWITERKNVLSLLFTLLTLQAWVQFLESPARRFYALALAFFALALFSKTTACTLPFALLLVVWLKKKPIDGARLMQIIPFLAVGAGMGLLTIWWERHHQGTGGEFFVPGWPERCLIASRAIWFYLGKLFWPVDLSFSYPRWNIHRSDATAYLWPLALGGLAAVIYYARRRAGRGVAVAAWFYVVTLSPLLGFIMLYTFRYSFVADHYQYVASIGPIALAAAGGAKLFSAPGRRVLGKWLAGLLLATLGLLTWRQCGTYADAETLWRATLARNPASSLAETDLGLILFDKGEMDAAATHLQRALEINPDNAEARVNLGNTWVATGRLKEAVDEYQKAIALRPFFAEAHAGLGRALFRWQRTDEAIAELQRAISLKPQLASAHANLGDVLLALRRSDDAVVEYQRALALDPRLFEVHHNLGSVFLERRNLPEAISQFQQTIALRPQYASGHNSLGIALFQQGELDAATAQFRAAIALQPGYALAQNNLGLALAQKGAFDEAIAHYQIALNNQPQYAQAHHSLALALLKVGRRDEAILHFKEALRLNPADTAARDQLRALGENIP